MSLTQVKDKLPPKRKIFFSQMGWMGCSKRMAEQRKTGWRKKTSACQAEVCLFKHDF